VKPRKNVVEVLGIIINNESDISHHSSLGERGVGSHWPSTHNGSPGKPGDILGECLCVVVCFAIHQSPIVINLLSDGFRSDLRGHGA
jgi:hypothetical protein